VKRAATILSMGLVILGCTSTSNQITKPQPERAAEINLELGIEHLRKGNLQEAKDKIDRALEYNPRFARGHMVAAMLYNRLGDEDKADSHFQRAASLASTDSDIKNNYAVYLCQKNRFARGEKMALEAAADQLYKTPEIAFMNAGNCARNAGDLKRAEEHFRKALGAKPRFGEALFQLAELEYHQTEYMSARAFLERYMEVGRTSPASLWLGVRIERGLGNKAQANHYAQRLKSEYPSAAQTRELLESERNPG
jgi:type IV pilus assembly protein PilF